MKTVAIHFLDMNSPPVGIWWTDEDASTPFSHYEEPTVAEALAVETMQAKVPDVPWESFWTQLEERTPFRDNWECMETDVEPVKFLRLLRSIAR